MSVPARSSQNLLKLFDNTSPAQNALSAEYDRRELRQHIFHLIGTSAPDSVIIQVSLDGTRWIDLATMTGVAVLLRIPGEVLPFIRAKRADATGDAITLLAYSAGEDGNFD